MTEQQKELNQRWWQAICTFNGIITKNTDAELSEDLEKARDTFITLYKEWRDYCGEPVQIAPEIISNTLRRLANKIDDGIIDV